MNMFFQNEPLSLILQNLKKGIHRVNSKTLIERSSSSS
ncbi:hypothetical protein LEP1GSC052_3101 [Leptospira kmetyi serovar Malaysia str. Bejo-Iso9]|nr:hypothetical protein LEP1GSC052_3101 [Leptospira kmetyi serovar Malaysia str. Bejo-Iso9]